MEKRVSNQSSGRGVDKANLFNRLVANVFAAGGKRFSAGV